MPHQPILPLEPFEKWGLDFLGPFKPTVTQTRNQDIIVAIDYCTEWIEVKVLETTWMHPRRSLFTNTFSVD